MSASPVCFQCGHPVGDPPQLHRLADGRRCPACRERALDAIPPALPAERPALDDSPFQGELFPESDGDSA
jgi:DNA-directed RNA polymerase subunit RPC12/RpoP